MSGIYKNDAEALREYMEAFNNYNRILDKYFPVRQVVPGVETALGEPITEEAFREIEEAEAKVTETRQKWEESLRRSQSERQSS